MTTETAAVYTESSHPAHVEHDSLDGAAAHPTSLLGASYNPFDPKFLKDPHQFFARARREAPVCYNPIFDMWLVTGYDEVLKVCEDPVIFSSKNKIDPPKDVRPEVLEILEKEGYSVVLQLFNSDPPEHDRISALVHQGFTQQSHSGALPAIIQLAQQLVSAFAGTGKTELRSTFLDPFPLSVILDYIGVPRYDHPLIRKWDDWWARLFTSAHAIDEQMEAVRHVVAYQKYFNALIDDRRAHPCDDLTSRLVAAKSPGRKPLSNAEMIWQFMGLLAAGHATTTDALTNLLYVVLHDEHLWPVLRVQPQRVPDFIDEGLRFVNPVLGLPRVATRTVDLGGVTIPEGGQVLVSFCSANRDPQLTPDADRFLPTREGVGRHLGFGRGIHCCVGARMSKNMMRVAIEVLLERLPGLRIEDGYEAEHTVHPFLWGLARLPVEWDVASG